MPSLDFQYSFPSSPLNELKKFESLISNSKAKLRVAPIFPHVIRPFAGKFSRSYFFNFEQILPMHTCTNTIHTIKKERSEKTFVNFRIVPSSSCRRPRAGESNLSRAPSIFTEEYFSLSRWRRIAINNQANKGDAPN